MNELMTGLAQKHEPILGQVIVVRYIHMMYIEVAESFVFDSAILTGHIP